MTAGNWQEAIVTGIGILLCIYIAYRIYRYTKKGGKPGGCSSCGKKCPYDNDKPCC